MSEDLGKRFRAAPSSGGTKTKSLSKSKKGEDLGKKFRLKK